MRFEVIVPGGVEQELEEIAVWFETKRENYGAKFIDSFDQSVALLSQNPLAFPLKYKSFREIRLEGFPYIVVFKMREKVVLVVRLIHTSRHQMKRYRK